MPEQLSTVRKKVARILSEFPQTRDNDVLLYITYLKIYHKLDAEIGGDNCALLRQVMLDGPAHESITRGRRRIQEGGMFQGEKRAARMERAEDIREAIGKNAD